MRWVRGLREACCLPFGFIVPNGEIVGERRWRQLVCTLQLGLLLILVSDQVLLVVAGICLEWHREGGSAKRDGFCDGRSHVGWILDDVSFLWLVSCPLAIVTESREPCPFIYPDRHARPECPALRNDCGVNIPSGCRLYPSFESASTTLTAFDGDAAGLT